MNDQQIKQFIETRKSKGDSDEEIKAFLESKGVNAEKSFKNTAVGGFLSKAGNVLGNIGKEVARPFAEAGVGLYNAGATLKSGLKSDETAKTRNLPLLGEVKPFSTGEGSFGQEIKKSLGTGLEIGANLVGGVGAGQVAKAGFKGAVAQGFKSGVKTGFQSGALAGAGGDLKEKGLTAQSSEIKSALNTIGKGIGSGVIGATAGAAFGLSSPLVGKAVRTAISPLKTANNLGKKLVKGSQKIQDTIIKPVKVDERNGFKIENVTKHDISGNLGDMFEQTQTKIKSAMDNLNSIIDTNGDHPTIPLAEAVRQLESKYKKQGIEGLGTKRQSLMAIEEMVKDLDATVPDWENKILTFKDTVTAKRKAGLNAAFAHEIGKPPTPQEQVWNDFYGILKDSLEKNSPALFKKTNKVLSELIPIEQSLIRRIPVAERNNVLSLNDVISFSAAAIDPRAAGIAITQRLLKSGKFAGALQKSGKKLINLGTAK